MKREDRKREGYIINDQQISIFTNMCKRDLNRNSFYALNIPMNVLTRNILMDRVDVLYILACCMHSVSASKLHEYPRFGNESVSLWILYGRIRYARVPRAFLHF